MAETAHDFAVIGGGIVGAAIAEGLARRGRDVAILDEGDVAIRAARGNLGNVWVQGKGAGNPAYADLTRQSAQSWPELADRLRETTGIDVHFERRGAVFLCFTDADFTRRAATMAKADDGASLPNPYQMLDHAGVAEILPMIGPNVVGASYTADDGTVNPLFLLRALLKSAQLHGATYLSGHGAIGIEETPGGFAIATKAGEIRANHVVFCAGLGNAALAPVLGMFGGVRPVRGQILVTERLQPFLPINVSFIRQTVEGGCVIGESSEEAGYDTGTTSAILQDTAQRAVAAFPHLAEARVVRAWGALRIMTPDGAPVYQMKGFGPNGAHTATVVSVHSGVSLCPVHCDPVAEQIAACALDPALAQAFPAERFDV